MNNKTEKAAINKDKLAFCGLVILTVLWAAIMFYGATS
tara:strand:+ start:884 stop:997 length:114 start_codon:yes stop_codon:yes gene_type:complete